MGAYYSAARFLVSGVIQIAASREVRGRENVPRSGGVIVAANHISFWDPPMIGAVCGREMYYLAKDELFRTPVLGWALASINCIPIRRGVADLSGLSRSMDALKKGAGLMMFPEGSRMKDGELHPARPGVGMMAVHAGVPIVPCYISGSNRPREWRTRGVRVRIWFGVARSWQDLAGSDVDPTPGRALYQSVGDAVMREIAILKTGQETEATRGATEHRRTQSR